MKIAIADDEIIYRKLLTQKLSNIGYGNIIFEADTGRDLLRKLRKQIPHIIFIDSVMPQIDGINVAQIITEKYPHLIMICYSHYKIESEIIQVRSIGFKGYLLKDSDEHQLQLAINAALEGKFYLDELLLNKNQSPAQIIECNEREVKLIRLIFEGFSISEIADKLYVATSVAYKIRSGLMKRYAIKSEAGLIKWALLNNIISLDKPETRAN